MFGIPIAPISTTRATIQRAGHTFLQTQQFRLLPGELLFGKDSLRPQRA